MMSPEDLAAFEDWLEKYATYEERELPYEKQVEHYIMWRSGDASYCALEAIVADPWEMQ